MTETSGVTSDARDYVKTHYAKFGGKKDPQKMGSLWEPASRRFAVYDKNLKVPAFPTKIFLFLKERNCCD